MESIVALIDYDNQRTGSFRSGSSGFGLGPNFRDHEDYLRALVAALLAYRKNDCTRISSGLAELRIRLYGGWLVEDGSLSEMAAMVEKALGRIGRSWRTGNTRVFVEIADRLLTENSAPFFGTFRAVPWLGSRLTFIGRHAHCIHREADCDHVSVLMSWARGRCPEKLQCNARTSEVFLVESQKLVDTMIVSDAILAHLRGANEIVAVSMDDDIVPAALAVAALNGPISVLRFGRVNAGMYDGMLNRKSIPIHDRPALR